MSDIVEDLRAQAPACFAGEPIAFAHLFGSRAAGTATARSDIDVAVHLTEDAGIVDTLELRLRLARRLEEALGQGPVEVVVLDESPVALAGRVREEGVVVFSSDEAARVRWDSLTARQYHDFRLHEERSARERLARVARGR